MFPCQNFNKPRERYIFLAFYDYLSNIVKVNPVSWIASCACLVRPRNYKRMNSSKEGQSVISSFLSVLIKVDSVGSWQCPVNFLASRTFSVCKKEEKQRLRGKAYTSEKT